ncbi:MAG: hypothetical protein LAO20_02970 [Acidobacteriia bacterium]|nr:hypothetical protein [Terriglobia bacterium]
MAKKGSANGWKIGFVGGEEGLATDRSARCFPSALSALKSVLHFPNPLGRRHGEPPNILHQVNPMILGGLQLAAFGRV